MYVRQAIAVLATAGLVASSTPEGFQPSITGDLIVTYGRVAAQNGNQLARNSTQAAPTLATSQQLQGTYAVIMIDLDIPTDQPPATSTLLHWMQTGLTSSTTSNGQGFVLENKGQSAALAEYFGPNPPDREPITHRYTFVLVDHSTITTEGLNALTQAAQSRRGFSATQALTQAGLADKAVAANFITVTNGDRGLTGGGSGGNGTRTDGGSGSGSGGSGGGTQTEGSPAATSALEAGGVVTGPQLDLMAFVVAVAGAMYLVF